MSLFMFLLQLIPNLLLYADEEMQSGDSTGASVGVSGVQSRSEDEESLGVKDVKRPSAQSFGSGVPKRRSSSRFGLNVLVCSADLSVKQVERSK